MTDKSDPNCSNELSLTQVDSFRDSEERARDGKSGDTVYQLTYDRKNDTKTVEGKVIEIGTISDTKHTDLHSLADEGYTHYGIFRLADRSTTTLVQDENGSIFKVFSFSKNNIEVSHPTSIASLSDCEGST